MGVMETAGDGEIVMSVDRSSSGSVSELAAAVAAADLAAEAVAEQVHGAVGFTFEHSLPC